MLPPLATEVEGLGGEDVVDDETIPLLSFLW